MRFMTYNIKHGQGVDLALSTRRVAETILRIDPAVTGLNEVWRREGGLDQAGEIARWLGMEHRFLEAHRRAGTALGNAILTRGHVVESFELRLARRWEGRIAAVARIEIDGVDLRFASTHLSLRRETRAAQLAQLAAELPLDLPLVLAGDFNATSAELGPLKAVLTVVDEPPRTYPSPFPVRAIDHIAFSAHWTLVSLESAKGMASDHRPLVAELALV